jgi:hypothetical protein
MKTASPLLIIYQWSLQGRLFWRQLLVKVAGYMRRFLQAEQQSLKKAAKLIPKI